MYSFIFTSVVHSSHCMAFRHWINLIQTIATQVKYWTWLPEPGSLKTSNTSNTSFTRRSKHEANLEHTSCTFILNTFASCLLHVIMLPRVNRQKLTEEPCMSTAVVLGVRMMKGLSKNSFRLSSSHSVPAR